MGSDAFLKITSDQLAELVDGASPLRMCLLYFGDNADCIIRGAVRCGTTEASNLKSVRDIEASIKMTDRIIFRSREFCDLVVVYSDGTDKEHRQILGRACKILSRDEMTAKIGYLTCFSDFQKHNYDLFENTLTRESSASSVSSNDSQSSHQSEYRLKAHNLVFQRLTDSRTYSCTPPSLVTDRIYLGNAQNALSLHQLQDLGITHIVNVSQEVPNAHESSGISYYSVSVEDTPEAAPQLAVHFEPISRFISSVLSASAKNVVLVHCFVGVSRSCAVLAAHLARSGFVSGVGDAIRFIKTRRQIVNPNYGLIDALAKYEHHWIK
eukprot:TRINITY_DN7832_c0_g1_i1.p1 TRINITY_DN7832_c0_g1~~TRINITY_DN7832_c0_g1_i1.p1  ORF type:complete len:351 (+),score=43.01 TRINITY_DN7832_c0_g1_i1:82-1053(+)